MNDFLNPYNFVSIPDREQLPDELRDGMPPGHDRYLPDRWTGCIPISITTATPLLIPDHTAAAKNDRYAAGRTPGLPVRTDPVGRPVLAGSAVKGMLRSAYETITNSRLGVFSANDRLAIRANARDALSLHPAIVVERQDDSARIRWVDALRPTVQVRPGSHPNPAVWVPIRLLDGLTDCSEVEAWIHLLDYPSKSTRIWRASDIATVGTVPPRASNVETVQSKTLQSMGHPAVHVRGVLHRTDSKLLTDAGGNRKHDERLVVTEVCEGSTSHAMLSLSTDTEGWVDSRLIDGWQAVIDSFTAAHDTESDKDKKQKYGSYVWDPGQWRDLRVGRTLYVQLDDSRNITGLFPAMIGRRPFAGSPSASLPLAHHPAAFLPELSPADRVFGWVRDSPSAPPDHDDNEADSDATVTAHGRKTAYRGHLRIEPAEPQDNDGMHNAVEDIGPLPLATLNSPKPAQFLFYLGKQNCCPLNEKPKEPGEGYPNGADALQTRRLRGRKTYLTHPDTVAGSPGAENYWTPSKNVSNLDSPREKVSLGDVERHREYEAPQGSKENLITTVKEWVRPGVTFRFTLRVENLSSTELGALLWLLALPDDAYHKLGLGKPLGFGAVHVTADEERARLYTQDTLAERYRTLCAEPTAEPAARLAEVRNDFSTLLARNEALRRIRDEFLAAARGYSDHPVHYPRNNSDPTATSYDWWVANDKSSKGNLAARHALPPLLNTPPLLPYHAALSPNSQADPKNHRNR